MASPSQVRFCAGRHGAKQPQPVGRRSWCYFDVSWCARPDPTCGPSPAEWHWIRPTMPTPSTITYRTRGMFTPNAGRGSGRCRARGAAPHAVIIWGRARRNPRPAAAPNRGRLKRRAAAPPPASPALDCVPCSPCGRMPAETEEIAMVTVGLLVTLEAKPGKEDELASFLAGVLPLAQAEPETTAWFATKIDASNLAIVAAFPDTALGRSRTFTP